MFARIKDKCPLFYNSTKNNPKKNDNIITQDDNDNDNDNDIKTQELQFLIER